MDCWKQRSATPITRTRERGLDDGLSDRLVQRQSARVSMPSMRLAWTGLGMPDLKVISKLETEFELPDRQQRHRQRSLQPRRVARLLQRQSRQDHFGRQNTLTRDFTPELGRSVRHCGRDAEGGRLQQRQQLQAADLLLRQCQRHTGEQWHRVEEEVRRPPCRRRGLFVRLGGAGGSGDVGNGGSTPGDFGKGTTQARLGRLQQACRRPGNHQPQRLL